MTIQLTAAQAADLERIDQRREWMALWRQCELDINDFARAVIAADHAKQRAQAVDRDAQEAPFEQWWESEGQFSRAGGGQYEKTFAWNAWCAAKASTPTPEPEKLEPVAGYRGGVFTWMADWLPTRDFDQALRDTQPRMTKARAERLERLKHANDLIAVIGRHGRRFFWNEKDQRLARMELDERGKLWWVDDYRGSRVCIEKMGGYEHNWRGFSHGGTLKQLAQDMRNYVKTGGCISIGYIGASYWGYDEAAAAACKSEAMALPIIRC